MNFFKMIDFSFVIINYNCKKYIKNCLKSCINQKTKFNYEIILVDDASTDKSLKEIINFKSKILKIFRNKKNLGIEKTSNFGFKKAKGKYVSFLDCDDLLLEDKLLLQVDMINKKGFKFVYSNQGEK